MNEDMEKMLQEAPAPTLTLEPFAVLGDAAGMLGAAVYAKEQFLQSAANNGPN